MPLSAGCCRPGNPSFLLPQTSQSHGPGCRRSNNQQSKSTMLWFTKQSVPQDTDVSKAQGAQSAGAGRVGWASLRRDIGTRTVTFTIGHQREWAKG